MSKCVCGSGSQEYGRNLGCGQVIDGYGDQSIDADFFKEKKLGANHCSRD